MCAYVCVYTHTQRLKRDISNVNIGLFLGCKLQLARSSLLYFLKAVFHYGKVRKAYTVGALCKEAFTESVQ